MYTGTDRRLTVPRWVLPPTTLQLDAASRLHVTDPVGLPGGVAALFAREPFDILA